MDTTKTSENFIISENAAKRIAQLMDDEENKNVRLRISVLGGGCSGFQYNYDFDTAKNNDDLLFEKDGIEVVIDDTSIEFISGSMLDYVETLGSAAFEIKNPNATANCGCGNSFSV
jgi:iron-sulfur cluster insertion protein